MGTFVISIDDDLYDAGITLSENIDFENSSPRLLVEPITNVSPITFENIDFNRAIQKDGNCNNDNYIAYTFYLKNNGLVAIDLDFVMQITASSRNTESAVRIALIEDGNVIGEEITMRDGSLYIKDEEFKDEIVYTKLNSNKLSLYNKFNQKLFNNNCIDNYEINNFRPNDIIKYTLVVWLEGWDADCNDSIRSGQLKMSLVFSIKNIIIEEDKN